jgi:type IV pilus assembly protein PilN
VIRTNLSTRPFYNEGAVRLWLLIAALVVIAATIFNVTQAMRYRRSDIELVGRAQADEAHAAELQRQAARLRASVDPRRIDVAAAAAHQANELIDRRTFSWTELLNRLETTLPDEAHIVAIRPKLDKARGIVLTLNILAREVDDVSQFMENLEATGAFKNPRPTNERVNEQGLFESQIEANYTPANARPAATTGAER